MLDFLEHFGNQNHTSAGVIISNYSQKGRWVFIAKQLWYRFQNSIRAGLIKSIKSHF